MKPARLGSNSRKPFENAKPVQVIVNETSIFGPAFHLFTLIVPFRGRDLQIEELLPRRQVFFCTALYLAFRPLNSGDISSITNSAAKISSV